MRPDKEVLDTYRQYKAEEKIFIEWLISTSQKCGFCLSELPSATNHATESAIEAQPSLPIYRILPLVRVIAQSESIQQIPTNIATSLKRITKKRTKCAAWYQRNTKTDDIETQKLNKSHEYPLRILQITMEMLKSKLPNSCNPQALDNDLEKSMSGIKMLINSFDVLDVEECEESEMQVPRVISSDSEMFPESIPSSATSVLGSGAPPKVDSQHYMAAEEAMMLRYCLLQDFEAVEAFIIQLWMSYLTGTQPFVEAYMLMNQAIDLVAQQEKASCMIFDEDFVGSQGGNITIKCPSNCFHELSRTEAGNITIPILRMQDIIYKLVSLCTNEDSFPETGQDMGYFVASVDEQAKCEVRWLITALVGHRHDLQESEHKSNEGQFVRLMKWYINRAKAFQGPQWVPMCVAFAARVEILMIYILQDKSEVVKLDLVQSLSKIGRSAEECLQVLKCKSNLFANYTNESRARLTLLATDLRNVTKGTAILERIEKKFFLWYVSSLAIFVYHITWQHNSLVTGIIMDTSLLTSLASIHDMCCQWGQLCTKWTDLSSIEAYLGEKTIYRGAKPSSGPLHRYMFRIMHLLGFDSMLTAPVQERSRDATYLVSKDHRAPLAMQRWPMTCLLYARLDAPGSFHSPTSVQISLLLRVTTAQEMIGRRAKNAVLSFSDEKFVLENHAELASFAERGPEFSIHHTLALMQRRLRQESHVPRFNFVEFLKACIHLASLLGQQFQDPADFLHYTPGSELLSAKDLARVIMSGLASCVEPITAKCVIPESDAFRKVNEITKIFKEWIAKKGSVGIDKVDKGESRFEHLSSLKPSFLHKLNQLHLKHGTLDTLFTAEQREGIFWLDETTRLEDVMRELFSMKPPANIGDHGVETESRSG